MTDKLPEPNLSDAENSISDELLLNKYPRLAQIDRKDWEGIIRRAEREGVAVEDLKLREDNAGTTGGLEPDDPDRDLPGLLARARREQKQLAEMRMRSGDDVRRIYESMYYLLAQAGFPVREYFDEETGPVTKRSMELRDGMIKIIAEKKLDFSGGDK